MAKQDINIGAFPGDKSPGVDVVRSAFQKAKENFDELYARGQGDMLKSTYDSDNSGVVDSAEKIEGVEGEGTRFYGTKDGVPGFFDLVIEATNIVFYTDAQPRPLEGVQNVVYIDKTNKTVSIWDGANYQQVAGGTVTAQAIEDALGYLPNNYTHPSTHPASIIEETSGKRFVSDAEKAAWNAKQNALGFTPANDSEVVKGILNPDGTEIPKDVNGKVTLPEFGSDYDDTAIQNTLSNHDSRITALEGAATPQEPISVVWNTGDPLTFSLPKAPSAVDINGTLLSKWLEDGVTSDEYSVSGTTVTLNGITPTNGSNIQFHFGAGRTEVEDYILSANKIKPVSGFAVSTAIQNKSFAEGSFTAEESTIVKAVEKVELVRENGFDLPVSVLKVSSDSSGNLTEVNCFFNNGSNVYVLGTKIETREGIELWECLKIGEDVVIKLYINASVIPPNFSYVESDIDVNNLVIKEAKEDPYKVVPAYATSEIAVIGNSTEDIPEWFSKAFKRLTIFATDTKQKYWLSWLDKNRGNPIRSRLIIRNEDTAGNNWEGYCCLGGDPNGVEGIREGIETVQLLKPGGTDVLGIAVIDWDEIPDATRWWLPTTFNEDVTPEKVNEYWQKRGITDVRLDTSIFENSENKAPAPLDNIEKFTVAVNASYPDYSNTSTAQSDTEDLHLDNAAIALPNSYTATGTPTRLVLYCHGAGSAVNDSRNNLSSERITYLLTKGFACLDVNGLPETVWETGEHDTKCAGMGGQIALQCYSKAYYYVIDKYNLADDGVLLLGTSMGGLTSSNLLANCGIPVLAHCLEAPITHLYAQAWQQPWFWGAKGTRFQIAKYYNFEDYATFDFINSTPQEVEDYWQANKHKVVGYDPANWQSITVDGVKHKNHKAPLLIVHSKYDGTSIPTFSENFVQSIKNAGGLADVRLIDDGNTYSNQHAPMSFTDNVTDGEGITTKATIREMYLFFKRFI